MEAVVKAAGEEGGRERPGGSDAAAPRRHVSFAEAFRFWVKLGFISFGGPAGQIAIMHRELVERRRWIGEERFLHALNYCMLLPGPEAQQLAIYIGWLMHRTWGGIVAGAFFVIPSIFVLLALSYVYAAHGNIPAVAGVLAGFKPVVVAIVVEAVLKIGGKALKRRAHYVLAAASFVAIYFLHVPFPLIVLAAAGVGLAGVRFWPGAFAAAPKTKEADAKTEGKGESSDVLPLVIDDQAAPPPHTRPSRGRALKVVAVGIVLWLLPMLALVAWRGPGSLHAQEYRFFTQAALVTFGGAYAVLAYVTQAAAGSYGWLTQAQAVDGLALAETTPGPLIMVLQFVGFMAGWNNPQGMDRTTSAVVGALVTTYATFLPCFVFIFLGAPYIEVLRGNKNLTGALTGITAAVVGVVLNLALVFGAAVIWPRGLAGGTDFFALAMSAAAFVALYKFKADVLWVVLAGGLVGLGWTLLR
ncbi:MAG TPA: chromate efflux transporter [Pyrinomonadaceae bacterium]|jgi:chromate transporter